MRALGLILAGGNNSRMRELSNKRAIAAMPIAGSYRAIDFALSNMANSNIQKVAVITQYNARSLNEHLMSSKWWNFGRKQGGLYILTPTLSAGNSWWYRGTADSIYQNINWLKESHEPYVIIASGDGIYKMDFGKVLEYHIAKEADISMVCTEYDGDPRRFGVIRLNEDGRVIEYEEKPMVATSNLVSIGVYVIRRRLLIELIEQSAFEGRYDLVNDIFIRYRNLKKIYGYKMNSYWNNISSVEAYYQTNMDFLDRDVRRHFLVDDPHIMTKVDDLPPVKYNQGCEVNNSIISCGSIINGRVDNSLIFKNVYIGENSIIKNSIVLNDVYIGNNAYVENCIVESKGTVLQGSYYRGEDEIKIVTDDHYRYEIY